MIIAEFDVWHTRPVAPTRRVALGDAHLPVEPSPGIGGILLAAVVAVTAHRLDDDGRERLTTIMESLERGHSLSQPQLRHRLQADRVGLTRSTHRIRGVDHRTLELDLEPIDAPEPHLLAALYQAAGHPRAIRRSLFLLFRSATRWRDTATPDLLDYLSGRGPSVEWGSPVAVDPLGWACSILELSTGELDRSAVQRQYRRLLRAAHPDHGGAAGDAGPRIQELAEARRILLGRRSAQRA